LLDRNVEIVRALYEEIWGSAGPPDLESRVHPEVEILAWPNFPGETVLSGFDGFDLWTKRWSGVFEDYDLQPEQLWESGDFVVAWLHERATAGRSGIPIDEHYAHVWMLRDGLVVRVQVFSTKEEALAAAGLEE
jgi:ketosteroid isomerase-like protein